MKLIAFILFTSAYSLWSCLRYKIMNHWLARTQGHNTNAWKTISLITQQTLKVTICQINLGPLVFHPPERLSKSPSSRLHQEGGNNSCWPNKCVPKKYLSINDNKADSVNANENFSTSKYLFFPVMQWTRTRNLSLSHCSEIAEREIKISYQWQ